MGFVLGSIFLVFISHVFKVFGQSDQCHPIVVRWSKVKLGLPARFTGIATLQQCSDTCISNTKFPGHENLGKIDCIGFNFKIGNGPSNSECQIFDSSQKISLDDHVEADDQYAFFWKYCADKTPLSDSANACHSAYQFDFHIDRFMELATVERTLRTERLEDCLGRCRLETAFVCRSASFNRTGRLCSLSTQSRATRPLALRVNDNPNYRIDYYEATCADSSFSFTHECKDNGIVVSVDSKYPYSGALYGLYDFFTCRIEPKESTKFSLFFPYATMSKNCTDSYSQKGENNILEVVLSTDGMEPLYFLTDKDTMYQAKCTIKQIGGGDTALNSPLISSTMEHTTWFSISSVSDNSKPSTSTTAPVLNEELLSFASTGSPEIYDITTPIPDTTIVSKRNSTDGLVPESIYFSSNAPILQSTHMLVKEANGASSDETGVGTFSGINMPLTSTHTALLSTVDENLLVTSISIAPVTLETLIDTTSNFPSDQSDSKKLAKASSALSIDSKALWTSPDDFFKRPVSASLATDSPNLSAVSATAQFSSEKITLSALTIEETLATTHGINQVTAVGDWSTQAPNKNNPRDVTPQALNTATVAKKESGTITTATNTGAPTANLTEKVKFEISHNNQLVSAVVVASRIALTFTPTAPGSYASVIGCQVEPVNSPYASERDPIQIIRNGCQADGVSLVCPPTQSGTGQRIEMEALRYTHTSEVLFTCLARTCSYGQCFQAACRPVEGCALVALPALPSSLTAPLVPTALRLAAPTPASSQDVLISRRLVVVNSEAELRYFLSTGSAPPARSGAYLGGLGLA